MEPDELGGWLLMLRAGALGRAGARRLLAVLGSPAAVLHATGAAWTSAAGPAAAAALDAARAGLDDEIAATLRWRSAAPQRHLVPIGDQAYPPALLETADPPLMLFAEGRLALLAQPQIAVVGSRNPTPQGVENARAFAAGLSAAGWTVTSGLALGIDGAAHEGALPAAGSTVAVIGTGIDIAYPRRHLALSQRVAREGLLVSEHRLGTPGLAHHFPERNRIIAGLSRGTLVVEAAVRSGSLSTARQALEAGREVFAIPGSIHSPQSRGCHALIRQGAALVETVDDVLRELAGQPQRPLFAGPLPDDVDVEEGSVATDDPVMHALGQDPASLDTLLARTGLDASALLGRLLELELAGRLSRLPGNLYQQRSAA